MDQLMLNEWFLLVLGDVLLKLGGVDVKRLSE